MKICIVMITIDRSPRGLKNYFQQTMEQFMRSGLWESKNPFEFHVYDSGSPNLDFMGPWPEVTEVHESLYKIHPKINAGRALLAGSAYESDYVFFVEDDILVCKDFLDGAVAWIQKNAREDYRVITFYTPYKEVEWAQAKGQSYWEYPVPAFYGTQALAMRREDAESCGRYLMRDTEHGLDTPSYDLIMKDWHRKTYPDLPYFQATVPSFVQHIGKDSFLLPGRYHACGSFKGTEWSALESC